MKQKYKFVYDYSLFIKHYFVEKMSICHVVRFGIFFEVDF